MVFAFMMSVLGVARGMCDQANCQGKFGKLCTCHRL